MNHRVSAAITGIFCAGMLAATAVAFTDEQAAQGKDLFIQSCSVCHGPDASGGTVPQQFGKFAGKKVPALAGSGALSGMENAYQVYTFAKENMPPGHPGMLQDQQYLAIVAFALQANGIQPDGQPLTPDSAKAIKLSGGGK